MVTRDRLVGAVIAVSLLSTPAISHDLLPISPDPGGDRRSIIAALASPGEGIIFGITDNVTDGCWPSPRTARDGLIYQARIHGWNVDQPSQRNTVDVVINVNGKEIVTDYCVVAINFEAKLQVPVLLNDAAYSIQNVPFFSVSGMAWANKADLPKQIEATLENVFQDMINFINEAQRAQR